MRMIQRQRLRFLKRINAKRYIANAKLYIANARRYIVNARRYIANAKRYIINVANYILGVAIAINNRNCNKAIAAAGYDYAFIVLAIAFYILPYPSELTLKFLPKPSAKFY
ncbi:hypothetical protein [Aulosira sp. FACHB-615]|uniref:hypothetical protein n=1 Tax=Aulosira sp. FACHB-615 TaxID=2692777 RepID=UPI001F54A78B|nr:hypothetical protein [Aulosira sp. FACHB-615]